MKRTLLLSSIIFMSGCAVGPNYVPPRVTVLNDWGEQGREPTTMPTAVPSRTVSHASPIVEWWTTFHDPELADLIVRAVEVNTDVRRATSRLREARAQRGVTAADLFPTVNTTGQYQHVRASQNGVASAIGSTGSTSVNAGGGTMAPGTNGSTAIPGNQFGEFDLYQAGFDASWEIDVFGGHRRAVEASNAQVQAAVEDRRDVMLTVMGDVARNYVTLRATQQRLSIARDNLAAQQRTLGLTRQQFQQGLTNELDLAREEAEVATTISQVPMFEASISGSIHALSVLLDERPTALAAELSTPHPLPPVPDIVPIGLPSDLVRRRPDVRRAERNIATATANIGVATADLYPKFSLVGSLGVQSIQPGNLVEYASRYYSFGPMVTWPIFDAGRNINNVHVQEAREEQAALMFRETFLGAMRDVEDALVNYAKAQEQSVALTHAVLASQKSLRIANDLYGQGLEDFLTVLDAQRSLLTSQDALAVSQGNVATSLVALYKSLGGGWEVEALMQSPAATVQTIGEHEH